MNEVKKKQFTHLKIHTQYSICEGALRTTDLAKYCKENNINVISLTGRDGGELSSYSDIEIRVPHFGYSDRIQEIHIKIIHILILLIEKNI